MNVKQHLQTLPKPVAIGLAIGLLGVIGFLDFRTGHDFLLSVFYLLPIYWGTRVAGRAAGILLAVIGSAIWLVADSLTDYVYPHLWMLYWDAFTLLVFFVLFVYWLSRFLTANRELEVALLKQTIAVAALQTEIKERKLLEAAKLEADRFAVLGRMAAQLAHEIRNPLTAINIRLHSLKKNLAPNGSEQEDALVIGYEIHRLDNVVEEFLQFARPGEPKFLTISADSLLTRMQSLFGPQFARTSFRLNLESEPDTWVRVDPHQMEQVLINLVQNAAESMGQGGAITLRARQGTAALNGCLRPVAVIEVIDTGAGVPPEVRPRIFDPFFTTKAEGTGLGLAIAFRIVEKHGGSLEFHSEMNHGTTFVILLPTAQPETNHDRAD